MKYAAGTGQFHYRTGPLAGRCAGSITPQGYIRLKHAGIPILAHRFAWFLVHGAQPFGILDHINRDRRDNRIANLRLASWQENSANTLTVLRARGTWRHPKSGAWFARLKQGGHQAFLGPYQSEPEAADRYRAESSTRRGSFCPTVAA